MNRFKNKLYVNQNVWSGRDRNLSKKSHGIVRKAFRQYLEQKRKKDFLSKENVDKTINEVFKQDNYEEIKKMILELKET